jgi:tRNA uridine 5-carboxymethylaminomethyl modification enzyme
MWPLIETEVKYAGHVDRQQVQIDRMARQEEKIIPAWVDYLSIRGMKTEAKQRLHQIKPRTLGHAGRISGITPADLALLAIWMEKGEKAATEEKV